jgi:hypothetical protein
MKAKYIGLYIFQNRKYLEYEYRGCSYSVCADWNAEPIAWQHKSEQNLIDRQLDTKVKTTEDAQVGFDKLWNYFETGNFE